MKSWREQEAHEISLNVKRMLFFFSMLMLQPLHKKKNSQQHTSCFDEAENFSFVSANQNYNAVKLVEINNLGAYKLSLCKLKFFNSNCNSTKTTSCLLLYCFYLIYHYYSVLWLPGDLSSFSKSYLDLSKCKLLIL